MLSMLRNQRRWFYRRLMKRCFNGLTENKNAEQNSNIFILQCSLTKKHQVFTVTDMTQQNDSHTNRLRGSACCSAGPGPRQTPDLHQETFYFSNASLFALRQQFNIKSIFNDHTLALCFFFFWSDLECVSRSNITSAKWTVTAGMVTSPPAGQRSDCRCGDIATCR